MNSSFAEPASQDDLDAVNLHRDVRRRQSGEFADRGRGHSFEVRYDDLPIEGFKALHKRRQAIERFHLSGDLFAVFTDGQRLNRLNADEPLPDPTLPYYMCCGNVVSDTVRPRSQRTSAVEIREAAPELKMDFLEQVPTNLGIKLIGSGQPVQ